MESILHPLTELFYIILRFIHESMGLSWGWSIVLLTVIVRIVLIPLTWKQFKSTRAMQQLQPRIKELQAKYKDNREVLNQKMMEFYKENKVNPFGSCLPLLLQLPVFFALFYMLRNQLADAPVVVNGVTVAAKQLIASGHIPPDYEWLWIRDWGSNPSFIAKAITGFDLPLLILYVGSQYLSSLQMAPQESTQKIMMYAMPIGIGFIMFFGKWPAGLFIYWFTSNLWTVAQQYIIMKTSPAPPPATAPEPARPATSVTSGGASGAQRQRKRRKKRAGKS